MQFAQPSSSDQRVMSLMPAPSSWPGSFLNHKPPSLSVVLWARSRAMSSGSHVLGRNFVARSPTASLNRSRSRYKLSLVPRSCGFGSAFATVCLARLA